ncbi:restriction endonuclease subunit S [Bacillus toyonensis]|uniref:restriction endonuclease subunit S n=1 Tax=Bacillus toyonensis TaxID=155322 RepID=UPI000BF6A602|nr:restriction endonuclease subunit S [Bacillus toyonensis]PGE66900.1 hypothetical protein COM69_18220 [Bacillus toyonensis]PHD40119.1 hypothetical protein COF65_19720 [Bacillus toyonensis]
MLNAVNYTENPKFKPYKIGDILEFFSRKCVLEDDKKYQLVTVKRRNEGIVDRGIFKGEEIKTPTQFYLKAGDFLISKRQIVHGACEIVPEKFDGAIVSNEYSIIRGKKDIILTEYFNMLSKTPKMKNHYFLSSYGVDIEKMVFNVELWKKGIVYLPSVAEQQKIVNVYAKLNKKVRLQQKKIDLLQEQKKGFLQKMFPKAGETQPEMRFEGFMGDWEERKLKDIVKWSKGSNLPKSVLNESKEGDEVIHYADLYKFSPVVSYVIHWSDSGQGTVIPDNSLLFPMSDVTPVGLARTSTITKSGVKAGSDTLIGMIDEKHNSQFISYQINANSQKIIPLVTGTTVRHISAKALDTLDIMITSQEEQVKISTFFKQLDDTIAFHQQKLDLYKEQKKGFMQQLFI